MATLAETKLGTYQRSGLSGGALKPLRDVGTVLEIKLILMWAKIKIYVRVVSSNRWPEI